MAYATGSLDMMLIMYLLQIFNCVFFPQCECIYTCKLWMFLHVIIPEYAVRL